MNDNRLPTGWRLAVLGDVAEVVGGSTPKTSEPSFWAGDVPWITPNDLSGYRDKYIERGERNITRAGLASCSARLLPVGAVLFSTRAPVGYVVIARAPVCTNQGFKSFICEPSLDPEYLYWYLRSAKALAESHASGTTFLELSKRASARLPIPLPPKSLQRRIVEEIERQFSRIDVADRALKGVARSLRRCRDSIMAAAVTGGLNGRGAGVSDTSEVPSTWRQSTLGELAEEVHYGTSVKTTDDDTGVPVLRMGNVVDGRLKLRAFRYLPVEHAEFPDLLLESGDILFNRTNSRELVGKAAVYRGDPSPCSFASYLIRIRLGAEMSPAFLAYFLNSRLGRKWALSVVSQQVGQANINGSKLRALPLHVPPLSEQLELVAEAERQLSVVEELQRAVEAGALRANSLGQAILADAFSGRLTAIGSA